MTKERKRFLLILLVFGIFAELMLLWRWKIQDELKSEFASEPVVVAPTNHYSYMTNSVNGFGSEHYIWETWNLPGRAD